MEPVKEETAAETTTETPETPETPETTTTSTAAVDADKKADREARMRERRRQRLAQHAGAREELITGVRHEAPPTAAAGAAGTDGTGAADAGTGTGPAADLERLLRDLRGGMAPPGAGALLPPRARRAARWGVLLLALALAGWVAHALAGVPAARLRVALTTDSGSAWWSRRVAVLADRAQPAQFAAGDVVAAHTTVQHDRLVRAVVLDGVPVEARADGGSNDGGGGEEGEEEEEEDRAGEAPTVREWRVVPVFARRCADGAWVREDAVAGRVLLSLPPLVLLGTGSLLLRLVAWALRP